MWLGIYWKRKWCAASDAGVLIINGSSSGIFCREINAAIVAPSAGAAALNGLCRVLCVERNRVE